MKCPQMIFRLLPYASLNLQVQRVRSYEHLSQNDTPSNCRYYSTEIKRCQRRNKKMLAFCFLFTKNNKIVHLVLQKKRLKTEMPVFCLLHSVRIWFYFSGKK